MSELNPPTPLELLASAKRIAAYAKTHGVKARVDQYDNQPRARMDDQEGRPIWLDSKQDIDWLMIDRELGPKITEWERPDQRRAAA